MKIKICGITNKYDAALAVEYGTDMLGFILYPQSKRYIPFEDAHILCSHIPEGILKVAVLVNESREQAQNIASSGVFDALQLHGNESPSYCNSIAGIKVFKAFGISSEKDLAGMELYDINGYVLDTYHPTLFGGTGLSFDWKIAKKAKKKISPIILSGGLTPDNVQEAIRTVEPWAVDVNSGIEAKPGKKDPEKMKRFLENARRHT